MSIDLLKTCQGVEIAPPQKQLYDLAPGDLVFIHLKDWWANFNFFAPWGYRFWNHCAIVVNEYGDLVELFGGKYRFRNINAYDLHWYTVVKVNLSKETQKNISATALDYALFNQKTSQIRNLRGWNILASLFDYAISFGLKSWQTPAGLVLSALEQTDINNGSDYLSPHWSPARLAYHLGVVQPQVK